MNEDTAELARRTAAGDRSATDEWCRQVRLIALRAASMMLPRDAEDIAQIVCLALWRKAGAYNPRWKLSTWVGVVTKSTCRDWIRSPKMNRVGWGRGESIEAHTHRLAVKPEPLRMELEHVPGRVWRAIAALPRHQRETCEMVIGHGVKAARAAASIGCPVGTAKSRLLRGQVELRNLFGANA